MTRTSYASQIENTLNRMPGVPAANVNLATERVTVRLLGHMVGSPQLTDAPRVRF
ncbi:MAG: heavy-metal-associated domain-containing protein [Burkholderiales bacterium]|nr:heavy-metal-associated domain-containing protein [Burkholderiales bacterium]MDE2290371.1 heavy-metal-associated domain-containing protein [Burkholderiales bacterium]